MKDQVKNKIILNNGVEMPLLDLGVYQLGNDVVGNALKWALEAGYRSIDTATAYGNETGVGKAIRNSSIPRKEIFVTTKVWNSDQGYDSTLRAFDQNLERLQLDYLDLYLIHWPVRGTKSDRKRAFMRRFKRGLAEKDFRSVTDFSKVHFKATWRAMETLYTSGRVRAIGVSNFLPHHLDDLMQEANVVPALNQIEYHPYLQQHELISYCHDLGITPQAWSPLMKGEVLQIPELIKIGGKYGKTAVQVTLRWMLQKDILAIPKSAKKEHIEANVNIFDFELTKEEMAEIDGLDRGHRIGPHPDNFNF